MRPDIDRERFARDVAHALDDAALSTRAAGRLPGLNPAMISRATTGQVLSAASMLTLCRVFGLDPFAYLIADDHAPPVPRRPQKSASFQAVTAIVPRETSGLASRAAPQAAPAGPAAARAKVRDGQSPLPSSTEGKP